MKPTTVFEVGTWKGFSTWIIEQAAPDAEVFCFDPLFFMISYMDPEKIGPTYRSAKAHYSGQDFSCADIAEVAANSKRPLAFFDDHQNKLPRLLQSKGLGIKDIIFDDNTPHKYTHKTFENDKEDTESRTLLEQLVQEYEIFPALWDINWLFDDIRIKEKGLKRFPKEKALNEIYDERKWHSYVTYVNLR